MQVHGKQILIDTGDKPVFDRFAPWHFNRKGYVVANKKNNGVDWKDGGTTVSLHRMIMQPDKDKTVDHINHDILDNRRTNLRICTSADNTRNMFPRPGKRFKGVHQRGTRFRSLIRVNNKLITLGTFDTAEQAAFKYNEAAMFHFGEFASLNKV